MLRMMGAMLLGAVAVLVPLTVAAQTWQPTKPITIVIPFPPGPGLDLVARMVGDKLGAAVGQPVVYENRTGANGRIAAEYVFGCLVGLGLDVDVRIAPGATSPTIQPQPIQGALTTS